MENQNEKVDELVHFCKTVLRIKHNQLNEEIKNSIQAFLIEVNLSGIEQINLHDPLIQTLLKNFIRSENNFNEKGEKYRDAFDKLLIKMALSSKYGISTSH